MHTQDWIKGLRITTVAVVICVSVTYLVYVYVAMDRTSYNTNSFSTISTAEMERPHKIDLWFMSIKNDSWGLHSYAKQAILSAKNKTTLIPIVILEGHNEKLEKWMSNQDVTVVHMENHEMLKYIMAVDLISPRKNEGMATWQRLVIPDVIKKIRFNQPFPISKTVPIFQNISDNNGTNVISASSSINSTTGVNITSRNRYSRILHNTDEIRLPSVYNNRKIDTQYVLYTDADILFLNEIAVHKRDLPRYVSFAVQGDRWCCGNKYSKQMHSNAGVMMMNVTGYAEAYPEFVAFIKKNGELIVSVLFFVRVVWQIFFILCAVFVVFNLPKCVCICCLTHLTILL